MNATGGFERARKLWDTFRSRRVDIRNVRTVCLALGPYRNLTTLTASLLFLHPHCQVLNHAGQRIFGDARLDFIARYDRAVFERFVRYAVWISAQGKRGSYGGSITLSHAFDPVHPLRQVFAQSRLDPVKPVIHSLFWKESLRTSNHLRRCATDVAGLLRSCPELRFLQPVRNPLDCAVSSIKTGHHLLFPGITPATSGIRDVVKAILDEHLWIANLRVRHPDRFFACFEHELSRETLAAVARFLCLPHDETWLDAAMAACELKKGYDHESALVEYYRNLVAERFSSAHPDFAGKLLRFVDGPFAE